MIYGNTGAGLVDVNIPQSPLYQQALPNLRDVSAAAWGLPSLDDITVPDITAEKDIQSDTELTDKYFALASKLKDYAIKGRSVGIDVTKPKNNPAHLQYAQEWNAMYNDFLQTGKELKNAKQNIGVYNKAVTNPNAIVAPLEKGQVVTDDYLNQRSIETPFQNAKMLVSGYQKLKPIYDEQTFQAFTEKWIGDMDMVDAEAEMMKSQKPQLADQIDAYAEQVKAQMFPPQMDYLSKAKLAQAYQIHRQNLGIKQQNANTASASLEFRKSQQDVADSKFADSLTQLTNTKDTNIEGFGEFVMNPATFKEEFVPVRTISAKASDLKTKYGISKITLPDGTSLDASEIEPESTLIIVKDRTTGKTLTTYPVNDAGIAAFTAKYQQPFKRREEQSKNQTGTYDVSQVDGVYGITPNQQEVKVSTKTTNTTSAKATKKTVKKYKGLDANGNPIFE